MKQATSGHLAEAEASVHNSTALGDAQGAGAGQVRSDMSVVVSVLGSIAKAEHRIAAASGGKLQGLQRPAVRRESRVIVGLYLNPPDGAIVVCVDEKSHVQALNRTQPILPLAP